MNSFKLKIGKIYLLLSNIKTKKIHTYEIIKGSYKKLYAKFLN